MLEDVIAIGHDWLDSEHDCIDSGPKKATKNEESDNKPNIIVSYFSVYVCSLSVQGNALILNWMKEHTYNCLDYGFKSPSFVYLSLSNLLPSNGSQPRMMLDKLVFVFLLIMCPMKLN